MSIEWKTFNFFKQSIVPNDYLKDLEITSSIGGGGHLYFGLSDGNIKMTSLEVQELHVWKAHDKVLFMEYIDSRNVLLSIGEEESSQIPYMRIWDLNKKQESPVCIKSVKIQHEKVFPVTALAVLDSLDQIAIGLENGIVLVYKVELSKDRFGKHRVIYEDSSIITGLSFFTNQGSTYLYVTSISRIVLVSVNGKEKTRVLDEMGCEIGNCLPTPPKYKPEIVLGKKEAVYFYGMEGRGPCFILQSEKSLMTWFGSYLVIVSSEPLLSPQDPSSYNSDPSPTSPTILPSNSHVFGITGTLGTVLTIYDLKSKFIAFRSSFGQLVFDTKRGKDVGEGIVSILHGPSQLYILTRHNHLYTLAEKDLESRLSLLTGQHMYDLAINMLTVMDLYSLHSFKESLVNRRIDDPSIASSITEIHKKYADYLFDRGDYSSCIGHYLKTIPWVSPSYVILKFIDPCHIHHLTLYLQTLYEAGAASNNHVNLLLNCYSKLKETDKLYSLFSKKEFDLQVGIRICKSSGFYELALELAQQTQSHDSVIHILLNDLQDPSRVLAYICQLEQENIELYIKKYGLNLMKLMPREITDILVVLCQEYAFAEDFIHFFVHSRVLSIEFLEKVFDLRFNKPIEESLYAKEQESRVENSRFIISNTLFELYVEKGSSQSKALDLLKNPNAKLDLEQCLISCQKYSFQQGILYIYKCTNQYKESLSYYAQLQDYSSMKTICISNQERDPRLWIEGLKILISMESFPETLVMEFVIQIDTLHLLEPLEILEILFTNPQVQLGMVQEYLISKMTGLKTLVQEQLTKTESYQKEIDSIQEQITHLSSNPITFQSSKCELCRQLLELPCIHFLCQHSYHSRCMEMSNNTDTECPKCAPEKRILSELLKSRSRNANNHANFIEELEKSNDPISYISDCFSRNVFLSL